MLDRLSRNLHEQGG